MKFLVDRCAGRRLAEWLREAGHDVLDAWELGPDPGDRALLLRAHAETRVLVTLDTDFGELVYFRDVPHAGLIRLPDVPADERIALMAGLIERHRGALEAKSVITVGGGRIRVARRQ